MCILEGAKQHFHKHNNAEKIILTQDDSIGVFLQQDKEKGLVSVADGHLN